ncbi:UDP-N-acetylglucosamine transporter UGNT1-like isoform X1 [Populus alba x Populus x berolinensis]|uniref:UDP-N-acetylglucosamine transporter UGNT1-like isoform X1 n=1 Tax=Populus alba x Populus x berolinensis TaxID=444605 RepID=A0AAD6LFP1_9ROSI|nr:UDP-N-acetylglucosamine transporter UGNT1-like isoform X1 [Populus alba x Populus x berolinensis]
MDSETNKKLPVTDPLKSEGKEKNGSAMTKQGAYAAISYMASAVLLVMFNKAALSSYSFPYANVITLFQMLCSCLFLYVLKFWKIISFTTSEPQNMSNNPARLVSFKTLLHSLPLALSYLLYMLITMESVRAINVPMYTTLRRTTVAFTMIVEYLLTGQKHSLRVVGSVGIIILGAFVAGARDLSFDAYGYAVVFVANICTAVYLASIARIGKSSGLNSFGLMWCNGIICGPILLFWTSFRGDLEAMRNFPFLFSPGFQVVMLLSCIMAFLINYFVFMNTTLNSALTQTICGNLKDLFTIGFGWILFGGLPFDLLNVVGQSLGFFGSCLYAYYKLKGQ